VRAASDGKLPVNRDAVFALRGKRQASFPLWSQCAALGTGPRRKFDFDHIQPTRFLQGLIELKPLTPNANGYSRKRRVQRAGYACKLSPPTRIFSANGYWATNARRNKRVFTLCDGGPRRARHNLPSSVRWRPATRARSQLRILVMLLHDAPAFRGDAPEPC